MRQFHPEASGKGLGLFGSLPMCEMKVFMESGVAHPGFLGDHSGNVWRRQGPTPLPESQDWGQAWKSTLPASPEGAPHRSPLLALRPPSSGSPLFLPCGSPTAVVHWCPSRAGGTVRGSMGLLLAPGVGSVGCARYAFHPETVSCPGVTGPLLPSD